jgi:hypothetical protein
MGEAGATGAPSVGCFFLFLRKNLMVLRSVEGVVVVVVVVVVLLSKEPKLRSGVEKGVDADLDLDAIMIDRRATRNRLGERNEKRARRVVLVFGDGNGSIPCCWRWWELF